MIDYLRGKLAHREAEFVVLDVHGIGYRVFCANPYSVQGGETEETVMYIHYHVREDATLLYGFTSRDEQGLFRKLLDVTGIGPRVAIGILSAGRPEAVISAIYAEDLAFLTKLPGIGKKTAQRIILDLKDKLDGIAAGLPAFGVQPTPGAPEVRRSGNAAWEEAREALLALGYTGVEADRVWPAVQRNATGAETTDVFIKMALQELFKG
jgi:Holliday junction DNA helicase RuvA